MRFRFLILTIFSILLVACGSASDTTPGFNASVSTQAPPVILRVSPLSGTAGDTITLFGFGFSSVAAANIVVIGGAGTSAATYALVNPPTNGEAESLTVQVPAGAIVGADGIYVIVFENTSNADVQFTVTP
ncbi:MAG: IPT/TIG domain-containing protein [Deltaproteobacteria bacterium]|nr:IPT/TIG domain-containing protein [Deltaproteobacteria bacterium]